MVDSKLLRMRNRRKLVHNKTEQEITKKERHFLLRRMTQKHTYQCLCANTEQS